MVLIIWTWTVRLALPLLIGVLAAALRVIWSEPPYAPGVLDILGTIGIAVTMLGMVVWCACAWLGSEGEPERGPEDKTCDWSGAPPAPKASI